MFFDRGHTVVFCNSTVICQSITQHMLVINIKNMATCVGSLNLHQAKYRTQYRYIQRVRTVWDPILFTNYMGSHGVRNR